MTVKRLERDCFVLFSQYRCEAYIGRGWQHFILLMQAPFHQQSSQILFHAIQIMGDKLTVNYRRAFLLVLEKIKAVWLPKYRQWLDDP